MTLTQPKFYISLFHLVILCWIHYPTFSKLLQNLISKCILSGKLMVEGEFFLFRIILILAQSANNYEKTLIQWTAVW